MEDGRVIVVAGPEKRGLGEYMRRDLRETRHKPVMVTVSRTVTVTTGLGLLGSKTREEVKGPWAATTRHRARRKRRDSRVGMVEGEEGRSGRSGQWRENICWEEKPRQRTRTVHDLKVSMPLGQMECSRKRTLVAQTNSRRYPRQVFHPGWSNKPQPIFRRFSCLVREQGGFSLQSQLAEDTSTCLFRF